MWVTYSWGFSDATEREDREFITKRLKNFATTGVRAHAYVQGLNVVTAEFPDADFYCRDLQGRKLPYSKGRSFICPNHPATKKLVLERVKAAAHEDFAGVYVDNVLFGVPPWHVSESAISFFGCACEHCQAKFVKQFGGKFPRTSNERLLRIAELLQFRVRSIYDFVEPLSQVVRAAGKEFGVNLYDPQLYTPELYFGFTVESLAPLLDYLLIENHSLPRNGQSNAALKPMIEQYQNTHDIFVVSYAHGIGWEAAYTQDDINAFWTESAELSYSPCLKATEFLTGGVWHALNIKSVRTPQSKSTNNPPATDTQHTAKTRPLPAWLVTVVDRWYVWLITQYFENPVINQLGNALGLYQRQLSTPHRHAFVERLETKFSR